MDVIHSVGRLLDERSTNFHYDLQTAFSQDPRRKLGPAVCLAFVPKVSSEDDDELSLVSHLAFVANIATAGGCPVKASEAVA